MLYLTKYEKNMNTIGEKQIAFPEEKIFTSVRIRNSISSLFF